MAVSLEKSSVREYTPVHLTDEEITTTNRLSSVLIETTNASDEPAEVDSDKRINSEESEILVTTEKEDLPAEESETETKADKAFKILLLIICIWIVAFGVGMIIFTGFNAVEGLQDAWAIADESGRIEALGSVLFNVVVQGLCGISLIVSPRLIHGLMGCRRF